MVQVGASVGYFGGNILLIKDDLASLRPTFFVSVPRLYQRFYDVMQGKIKELTGLKGKLCQWGIEAKMANLSLNGETTHSIYDKLIFNKFRESMGGRVKFMVTGSAPLAKEIVNFMKIAMCCPFFEGYGQTESSAGICLTKSEDPEAGHVGGVIPCGELKLVDIPEMKYLSTDEPHPRGEVCVRGGHIFCGYFKQADKTAETIDKEGWLHTGDIGVILSNGALKIVDRKKNIFKLSQGEYIAPDKLEGSFGLIDIIKQIFVYGDSL